MKIRHTLLFAILLILAIVMTACNTSPDIQEIGSIPDGAVKIMTSELLGQSGTYTKGSIHVSGSGYIVLDVQLQSGSLKSVGIHDAAADETIYTVSNPKTALYDSAFYEYNADSEYKLRFVDAKEINGSITVYFVSE